MRWPTLAGALPKHVLADEKHTRLGGGKCYVATTVAKECVLGVAVAENAGTEALTKAYGVFAEEAKAAKPGYRPETVNTDGWAATQNAWAYKCRFSYPPPPSA
ncbi:hypothetical protein [Methylovulum psychrotolerans]|uniref:IS6 family transposase n=1 Tax=Methylovulum psychrotolerans TaxID=1704499 RepID=A0A2S5CHA7_9GAMM|nr:hypothetical protein [Methylovulum psychrotolerans]POZ50200.1 hypothetical protein AADEFJLK_03949 [Methylovulum psychrotolerans]